MNNQLLNLESKLFFAGLIIAAVSAIKCTPQNKIVLLSTLQLVLIVPKSHQQNQLHPEHLEFGSYVLK